MGVQKNQGFVSDTAELAWMLFKATGKINYYCLYNGIVNAPELVEENILDEERVM